MAENLLNRKDNNYKSAEKYVLRYFDDLQNHFSLSDMQIVNILKNTLLTFKKRTNKKKWWQFF